MSKIRKEDNDKSGQIVKIVHDITINKENSSAFTF